MNRKVIIDTDPGVDDAIALLLAMKEESIDIKGIISVGGNIAVDITSRNALDLVALAARDIPVYKGEGKPLYKELETASHIHGKDGMGPVRLERTNKELEDLDGVSAIYKIAKEEGGIDIICLGPLTNIAKALLKYDDLKEYINALYIMGASENMGNVTKYAEFNIYADPDAAKIVFESGLPIYLAGLEVTTKTVVKNSSDFAKIGNKVGDVIAQLVDYFIDLDFYHSNSAVMHDALAVAYYINNKVGEIKSYNIEVNTSDSELRGKTTYKENEDGNVNVIVSADNDLFVNMLLNSASKY